MVYCRRQSQQWLLHFALTITLSVVLHTIHAPYIVVSAARLSTASKCPHSIGAKDNRNIAYALSKRDVLLPNPSTYSPVSGRKCSTDAQCVVFRTELSRSDNHANSNTAGNAISGTTSQQQKTRLGEYACIGGTCRYIVKAGELCFSSNDCAAFQLNRRWEQPSASDADTVVNSTKARGRLTESLSVDHQGLKTSEKSHLWCAPEFCTLEATCGGAWTLPGAPNIAPPGVDSNKPITNGTISCCGGFLAEAQCGIYSGVVDTCSAGFNCAPSSAVNSAKGMQKRTDASGQQLDRSLEAITPIGKCVSQEPHQQVWIGVLLVLIGGATLNIGLNLQKYAFRKRQEKIKADTAAAAASSTEGALVATNRKGAHPPLCADKVMFYSSDVLNKTKAYHDWQFKSNDMRKLPRSTDAIYSTHSNCENASEFFTPAKNHTQPVGEPNLITAEAANLSRISLASNKEIIDLSPPQAPTHQQNWRERLHWRISCRRQRQHTTPIGNPIWILGLSLFVLGNVINFVALQFAPQSLVAPLGAVSLVTNVIIAPLLNKERISLFDIGGIALIIAGCVIVVVFSGIVQQNFRLCVLVQLLKAKPTVVYLCLIFAAIIAIYAFLWSVERGVERYQNECDQTNDNQQPLIATRALDAHEMVELQKPVSETGMLGGGKDEIPERLREERLPFTATSLFDGYHKNHLLENASACRRHSIDVPQTSTDCTNNNSTASREFKTSLTREPRMSLSRDSKKNDTIKPTVGSAYKCTFIGKLRQLLSQHPLMVLDRFIRPIPPTSRHVRFGLPLAYASLGSFMATLTTLFAKSLVNLLSVSLFDHDNQFNSFLPWAILLITAFTAASQVYWINQGLQRYDALLQVPVFYVVWTVFDIIGGGIYFNEFRFFTTVKYVLFVLGVAVIFSGVGLLSHRLKNA
ncbi:hypothetical protein COEREDRAFT_86024 [Coemansia reversa NRRL 1564]|uniref:DUF803-domain-containing protein n=1 Tax=Coemansia reversa (strain ATCC 12441 / NRRL 1564) TaxID=763665 RepID=A0A2G5BFH5_COERN|nr:hypothetical protein COEREDRAFT_86024 [Coemansia reversa NRRL 1564]|eukprot:PIA17765.1 hypothetical protein COEREDRAFT_86024 [Coemansia reversa NRRL 1564]